MKPTKTLIAALYSAADRIETGKDYNWYQPTDCNCGILAQELLNINGDELQKLRDSDRAFQRCDWGTWSSFSADAFCPTTGLPMRAVFVRLFEHGLELKDFACLERHSKIAHEVAPFFREIAAELETRRSNGEKP